MNSRGRSETRRRIRREMVTQEQNEGAAQKDEGVKNGGIVSSGFKDEAKDRLLKTQRCNNEAIWRTGLGLRKRPTSSTEKLL
ncbi:hypothetical protein E2C01_084155 [Portunus trituberculatus]|uniref:Uncharacterized protein n=1 Tax=Portunus trituberculatus TaxID=210409 RepID=A0A5B7J3I7_PORTR|nr:hypothetical protein [Portunus trituberculatus]